MGNHLTSIMTLSRASPPPPGHPPVAMVLYYRYKSRSNFLKQVMQHRKRPPAHEERFAVFLSFGSEEPQHLNRGRAGVRGVIMYSVKVFLQSNFLTIFLVRVRTPVHARLNRAGKRENNDFPFIQAARARLKSCISGSLRTTRNARVSFSSRFSCPHLCLLFTPAELSRASTTRSSAVRIP